MLLETTDVSFYDIKSVKVFEAISRSERDSCVCINVNGWNDTENKWCRLFQSVFLRETNH